MANAINLKILEANERIITPSGNTCDELRRSYRQDRRDSPDRQHLEEVQPRLEPETGLVCRAVRRRLEAQTRPRGSGHTPW